MADDLKDEVLRNAIRTRLRDQNVKLWTPPYVQENGESNVSALEILAKEYSLQLNLSYNDCQQMLCNLQENAFKRMKEQEQFQSSRLATLHVRFSGFGNRENCSLPSTSKVDQEQSSKMQAEVEICLTATGKDFAEAVSQICGKQADQIKLIFSGQIIRKEENLAAQGIKNSSRIMAIALNDTAHDVDEPSSHEKLCEKTRLAASTLSKNSNRYAALELEDQGGSSLKLDQKEKEALCLALTLHERGRASLKRGEHSLALLLFLEADREFGQCNSELLKSVDNLALLQLDIVWCYLCLRSISHIPDANRRLSLCEITLERTYGRNLERVQALKGTAGNEAVLLMRLHLLQAIVAFHMNKVDMARDLIKKAEVELQSLKVNPDDIAEIAALGYSTSEALLGLRACHGDLNAAISKICEWQEERKKAREESKKEKKKERERRKLGKTADGSQYIEPDCVETLCGMGYERDLAICALKHSNNHITQAVHLLQEQPNLLDVKRKCVRISDEDITQIAAMGFDSDVALLALRKHNGNIEAAVSDLINNQGFISVNSDQLLLEEETGQDLPGHETEDPPLTAEQDKKLQDEQMEAAMELENDITEVENDHLCVTLGEEEMFLQEYKAFLNV